ncbi:MRC1-like domain-containing protein [Durotheca rogersii]|uniref:MRC1-like domain-containing protein n=1 Tax=Durotheca rogersii TaxID=419775 RepID=UPI002220BDA4|nr:MRC1-like domain-containing protein [Durotheca rogersii]KAI5861235.1 MRC1-like domain-containing protein [Durotheca rogersii]
MASLRSPSPSHAGDSPAPTSPQLSPRSKIKALLAAVDNGDLDSETNGLIGAEPSNTIDTEPWPTQDAGEEDSEEEEIIRPRGRLAARMRAQDVDQISNSSKPPAHGSEHPENPAPANSDAENRDFPNANGDEEENDTIAPRRRRLARPVRSTTPEDPANVDRPLSPGLFVTPSPHKTTAGSDIDDDLPENLGKNERFLALVARKRQERLEKEAEEDRKRKERAERMAEQIPAESDIDDDVSDITDDEGGRKLTQEASRPARKASKKALEEMNRETQRISRSLQLAHEAKTKKKITKASLFERFNFKTRMAPGDAKVASSSQPTTPGSVHQIDVEMTDPGTPPSSPPTAPKTILDLPAPVAPLNAGAEEQETLLGGGDGLPSLEDVLTESKNEDKDKGKGKAVEISVDVEAKKSGASKPKRQVRVKLPLMQANLVTIDSGDELEITVKKKGRMDAVFDRLPEKKAQESRPMNVLRRLAHLSSPPKEPTRSRNTKPSMTPAELEMSLLQRAKAQAKLERERRLEFLRSKGISVQTEEERERERDQVEDIVARARQEVEAIMQKEREDAKTARKERKKNGEVDPLAWDDSDDDSFEDSEGAPSDIEYSGSEDENEEGEEEGVQDQAQDETAGNPLFEDEAMEDGESDGERTPKAARRTMTTDDETDDADELPKMKPRRSKKHVHVVSDDEDDVEATPKPKKASYAKSPSATNSDSPKIPTSVLRSARKTFIPGLPIPAAGPAGLGLTQIFAGTMDNSQAGLASGSPSELMPSFDCFPDSQFSATASQSQENNAVLDSQRIVKPTTQILETQTQGVQLHFSQSQVHGLDSFMQMDGTQMSELIQPTQDGGFQDFSPLKQRFVEHPQSTIETVLLGTTQGEEIVPDSPLVKRKGRLTRRGETSASFPVLSSTVTTGSPSAPRRVDASNAEVDTSAAASAFKVMERAARKKKRMQEKFDRKKSKATEMVEEQAEESEDEYAGLGGADGEDSSEEDEELAREMIDDTAGNDIDEAKLAGFFADRERAADAAQVDKLFRDITTGMLRKRRRGGGGGNNDFDLSDSDDGGEARRRMKRRQFAKMQKALFADERIGKIAENPRNAAFLKSIEDRHSDDEDEDGGAWWAFEENFAHESADGSASQSRERTTTPAAPEQATIPDSQPANARGSKRAHASDEDGDHVARPPPNARRTHGGGARPSSLADVRRSLSSLLDEPNGSAASIVPATELGSDNSDDEAREVEERRRRPAVAAAPSSSFSDKENRAADVLVVDRLSLKRNLSSGSGGEDGSSSRRLAFAAPSGGGNGGFKVPALLRRATTNSLISSSSASSSSSSAAAAAASGESGHGGKAGGDEAAKLKKTAGKRSGINYFARETERRAAVAEAEKRREARKWKGAEGRGKAVGGLFGGGRFE